jgi:hypothetical protein
MKERPSCEVEGSHSGIATESSFVDVYFQYFTLSMTALRSVDTSVSTSRPGVISYKAESSWPSL